MRTVRALLVAAVLVASAGTGAGAQDPVEPFDATNGYDHVNQPPPGAFSSADWCLSFTDAGLVGQTVEITATGPSGTVVGTGEVGADRTVKVRVGITEGGVYTITSIVVVGGGAVVVPESVQSIDVVFDPEVIDCFDELAVAPESTPVPEPTEVPEATAVPEPTEVPAQPTEVATEPTEVPAEPTAVPAEPTVAVATDPEPVAPSSGGSSFPWWIFILIAVPLILWGLGLVTQSRRRPDHDPTDDDPDFPGDSGLDILEEPPLIFTSETPISAVECDWGAKVATAVDSTHKVGKWHTIKAPKATECARYEVVVASTLHAHTPPAEVSEEKQVTYNEGMFRTSWWEILNHLKRTTFETGNPFRAGLTLRVKDSKRSRSRTKFGATGGGTAPATRNADDELSDKIEYHESLHIRIKLEPGPHKDCFPGGAERKHEFWGTGAAAGAAVAWTCAHSAKFRTRIPIYPLNKFFDPSCGNSSPKGLNVKVGGTVKSKQLTNFSYSLVEKSDTKTALGAGADGVDAKFTFEPKVNVPMALGPLDLGSFSLTPSSSHPEKATKGFNVKRTAAPETQTIDEVVINCDSYLSADGNIKSHKSDNWDNSVRGDIEGSIWHHFRIIGRTDEDAPCPCCRPGIEFILGRDLVAKQPGASGADAVIKVGTETITLSHPGWKAGKGWATPGETRAWTVTKHTSTDPAKKT